MTSRKLKSTFQKIVVNMSGRVQYYKVFFNMDIIYKGRLPPGRTTNNADEYLALISEMEACLKEGMRFFHIKGGAVPVVLKYIYGETYISPNKNLCS